MNWKQYCKANGIRYEYEGPSDVWFIAPKGKTFGNDCRRRFVEDIDELTDRDLEGILIAT